MTDLDTAIRLLEEALHLRHNGERAPGGTETWADWERRAERFLRDRLTRENGGTAPLGLRAGHSAAPFPLPDPIGANSMFPVWADVLIVAALPLILLAVLWKWGGEEPDNAIVHEQEDGKPPDSSSGDGDVLLAA